MRPNLLSMHLQKCVRILAGTKEKYKRPGSGAASNYTCFHGYPEQTWNIEFVAVKPEYRGKNLSLKLVQYCLELGKARGAKKCQIQVFIGNIPAYKTYLNAGFKISA